MKEPYKEADGISMQILELFEESPVTLENAKNWITFCRTITSGLDVIKDRALNLLLDKM